MFVLYCTCSFFITKKISNEISNLRNKRSYINTNINNTNVLNYKVCQWHEAGRWFSPSTPVYTTNKTDHHDIFKYCWNGVKHHSHNLIYDINVKLNNKKKTSFKLIFYLIFIIFHPDYAVGENIQLVSWISLNPPHFVLIPMHDMDFQRPQSWSFCWVEWLEIRGGCFVYWYWGRLLAITVCTFCSYVYYIFTDKNISNYITI
jgi:hypothetical protein